MDIDKDVYGHTAAPDRAPGDGMTAPCAGALFSSVRWKLY